HRHTRQTRCGDRHRIDWGAGLFSAATRRGAYHPFCPHTAVGDVDADGHEATTHRRSNATGVAETGKDSAAVAAPWFRLLGRPGDPADLATPAGPPLGLEWFANAGAAQ